MNKYIVYCENIETGDRHQWFVQAKDPQAITQDVLEDFFCSVLGEDPYIEVVPADEHLWFTLPC